MQAELVHPIALEERIEKLESTVTSLAGKLDRILAHTSQLVELARESAAHPPPSPRPRAALWPAGLLASPSMASLPVGADHREAAAPPVITSSQVIATLERARRSRGFHKQTSPETSTAMEASIMSIPGPLRRAQRPLYAKKQLTSGNMRSHSPVLSVGGEMHQSLSDASEPPSRQASAVVRVLSSVNKRSAQGWKRPSGELLSTANWADVGPGGKISRDEAGVSGALQQSDSEVSVRNHSAVDQASPLETDARAVTAADCGYIAATVYLCGIFLLTVHPKMKGYFHGAEDRFAEPWFVATTTVCNVFTLGWMVMQAGTRRGRFSWLVTTTAEARDRYLRSHFLPDLLCGFPLELCFMALPAVCYWSAIRHWIRWYRIAMLSRSSNPFRQSRREVRFIAFLAVVLMVHFAIALLAWQTFGTNSEIGNPHLSFLDALYWTVATTSSTGFGDVSAKGYNRITAVVTMLMGGMMLASATAFATSALTNRDALAEDEERNRKLMDSMLTYYRVPSEVRREVVTVFPLVVRQSNETQFKALIQSLPPSLERQLHQYIQAKMLLGIGLFEDLADPTMLLPLVECLRQCFADPHEVIIQQGEPSLELFFLLFGSVQVVVQQANGEEVVKATFHSGSLFGEMELIAGSRRAASVIATTSCGLLMLSKDDFIQTLQRDDGSVHDDLKQRLQLMLQLNQPTDGLGTPNPLGCEGGQLQEQQYSDCSSGRDAITEQPNPPVIAELLSGFNLLPDGFLDSPAESRQSSLCDAPVPNLRGLQ